MDGDSGSIASVVVALLLRLALNPLLGTETPFILFFGAVLVQCSRRWPAPGLSRPLWRRLPSPSFSLSGLPLVISTPRQFMQLLLFLLEGSGISYLAGALCTANRASRAAADGCGHAAWHWRRRDCHRRGGARDDHHPVAAQLTGWSRTMPKGMCSKTVFRSSTRRTRHAVDNPVRRVLREGRTRGSPITPC